MKNFTFNYIKGQYEGRTCAGYNILSINEFIEGSSLDKQMTIVNRVDIDESCSKAEKIAQIFNKLNIRGTFFVRLHAKEYNPFSLENYRILKFIKDSGHDLEYHSEVMEQSILWEEDPEYCFQRDLNVFNTMFGIQSKGTASHGGISDINNLDFGKENAI